MGEYWDFDNSGYDECSHCGWGSDGPFSISPHIVVQWKCPNCGLVHGGRVDG